MVPALTDSSGRVTEPNRMTCELVLCVEGGPALDVKWMPMGAWDAVSHDVLLRGIYQLMVFQQEGDRTRIPKLGILAACQLDGTVSLYAVPHPRYLTGQAVGPQSKAPQFREWNLVPVIQRLNRIVKSQPLLKLDVADAACTTIEWINGSRIACGTSNGRILP